MGLQGVIFDMDGVLIDSSEAHYESWQRLAADLGAEVTREQFAVTFGRQNRDIIPDLFGGGVDPQRINELSETKERYYRELITGNVPTYGGASKLVHTCRECGLRCAIGSSGHPENIAIAIRAMGIDSAIEVVVSGDDVTRGKPDPQVFLLAAERLNLRPDLCAVVEDAPAGIDAGLAAGMTVVGIASQHARDKINHAHLVVDRIDELNADRLREFVASKS